MAAQLERPRFYEGQVLGSSDLTTLVDYGRTQDARDRRSLHTWGIADGLTLSEDGGKINVAPGMAIDSSGAQIIVPKSISLTKEDLPDRPLSSNGVDAKKRYPVFIRAVQSESTGNGLIGRCDSGEASRIKETYQVDVGRTAEASDWDEQDARSIGEGPDDSAQSDRIVLLGFIVWDGSGEGKISDVATEYDGVRPRYVGVHGDEIESLSGRITLRTQSAGTNGALMIVLNAEDENRELAFGSDDGKGALSDPVFSVDTKGNVTAKGTIKAVSDVDEVTVQSGIATDGVRLPLPGSLTEKQAEESDIVLHTMLTPRIKQSDGRLTIVQRCYVDEDRRVHCMLFTFDPHIGIGYGTYEPGQCDYIVVATSPSSSGESS